MLEPEDIELVQGPVIEAEQPRLQTPEATEELTEQIRDFLEREHLESALDLFNKLHPFDKGEVLTALAMDPTREMVEAIGPEAAADIFEHLDADEAATLSDQLEPQMLANILDATSPDVAADVIRQMSEPDSDRTLRGMWEAENVAALLEYPDDTAGGRMTTRYLSVEQDSSIGNVLVALRLHADEVEDETALFVINEEDKLAGEISIVRLALANPEDDVKSHMEATPPSVTVDTDQEECARFMERYDLTQLPVVDATGKLVGVLLDEDLVDVLEEEATEDMFRMAGIQGDAEDASMWRSVRSRLPWLFVNLATVFLAALTISIFVSTIARIAVVAAFLPVVMGQAGIGGIQSFTLVVRGMALGEITGRQGVRMMVREGTLGIFHGVLIGVAVSIVAYAWQGNFLLGVIIGAAMIGNMIVASIVGTGIPLFLRRVGVDPAVASAVFITTITDVVGALLTLGLAAILIEQLL